MRWVTKLGPLVLALALAAPAAPAAAAPQVTKLSGVIENCSAGPDIFGIWHENPNGVVGVWRGMPEEWVALLGGQIYTSRSVLRAEQYHETNGGVVRYHNAFDWKLYPGADPQAAAGWYELSGVADTVDSVPTWEPGFLVSHAAGVGRGALEGQRVKFDMVWQAGGPSDLALCPDPAGTRWHGTFELEISD